jgi:hypothetical protein
MVTAYIQAIQTRITNCEVGVFSLDILWTPSRIDLSKRIICNTGGRQYGSYICMSYKSEFTPFLVAACVAPFKDCCGSLFVFLWIYGFALITSRYLLTLLVTDNFTTKHWLLSLSSHRFIMLIDVVKHVDNGEFNNL